MKDYENFVARMGSFDMDLTPTETDQDLLNHFGVKGMKWGVRKARDTKGRSKSSKKAGPYTYTDTDGNTWTTSSPMTRAKEMERRAKYDKGKKSESTETKPRTITTKHGTEISFSKDKTPALTKLIAKMSPKVRELLENSENMTIKGPDGKTVGQMQLYKERKDSLNVVWVGVKNKERGKGYASAAMRGAVQFAKENNMKQVTLEVPGNSPDALHIYEKMGFKKGKVISDDDGVWGGLTEMKLDLDDTLEHAGVKGMKWGVRKVKSGGSRVKKQAKREYASFKRERAQLKIKDPRQMTDKELQSTLNRNRLENQLKFESKQTSTIGARHKGWSYTTRAIEGLSRKIDNRNTYLDRASLSDKDLQNKLNRMRTENMLVREANNINMKSIEAGARFIEGASDVMTDSVSGGTATVGRAFTKALVKGASGASSVYL